MALPFRLVFALVLAASFLAAVLVADFFALAPVLLVPLAFFFDFYRAPVAPANRSHMNVPFTLAQPDLDAAFLDGAKARGLVNLKGHRSVGGMRASIYNAVEQAAVDALVEYMDEFEREHAS